MAKDLKSAAGAEREQRSVFFYGDNSTESQAAITFCEITG
jgi:hypothetical protein